MELSQDRPVAAAALAPVKEHRWLLTRDFRLIWWSQVLSQVADGVSRLALLWFVYSVTGSALKTSVVGLLQTISPILLGPLIGVTVDRLPKKSILIVTDVARGILIGLIPCWLSIEVFTVEMLYVLVFLYGIATAMFVPTLSSSVPFLVDRPRFVAANAMLQSTTSIGIIIGPLLSGLGIAFTGSQEVLCANALIYFASALCLLPIRLPRSAWLHPHTSAVAATFQDLTDGIRYALISQRNILVLILLASVYTFGAGAYTTLFPVFGKKMLALGPVEVGYLWSWLGIGLFLVSLALVPLSKWETRKRIQVVSVSSVIGGAALCGMVWTHNLTVATVLVAIIGMGLGTWTPIAWSMIQEFVPAQMVGRVMAIYTAIATATSMAGISFFGWVTELADEYTSVLGIGFVFVLLGVAAAWFGRTLNVSTGGVKSSSKISMYSLALILALLFTISCAAKHPAQATQEPVLHVEAEEDDVHGHHEAETVSSMAGSHAHLGPHFRWTALRPANHTDQATAAAILGHLREALAPYRDYRVAIRDGYEPFLPNVQQPHYHFTSKWRGFKAAFRFDPEQPTSLLYRKTPDGYELEGAMFTAPKRASEADLNERIPLSIAQWHAHVHICLPQKKDMKSADWTRFGPKGSLVTETECDRAGGRFVPQLFGWMVHVYPFAERPEQIWRH